jgi:hypothetical protein
MLPWNKCRIVHELWLSYRDAHWLTQPGGFINPAEHGEIARINDGQSGGFSQTLSGGCQGYRRRWRGTIMEKMGAGESDRIPSAQVSLTPL